MFVKDNHIKSVELYFEEKLRDNFSGNEIKTISKSLIAQRLGFAFDDYLLHKDGTVSESDLLFFRAAVKRLLSGEPFQYILGETYFYNLELKVKPGVLIPRPETEELVHWIVEDAAQKEKELTLEDWCTGSGCIALALKKALPQAQVKAIDYDDAALAVAKENVAFTGLDVSVEKQDALNIAQSAPKNLDVIVSNPPYIPNADKSFMADHVLDHEPGIALFVDDNDPLVFYRNLGMYGMVHLKEGGSIYFELHENYAAATQNMLQSMGYFMVELKQDMQGKDRMLKATKF
ncbi:peptide chain release factor N(5)-glutamine methyltransferase [Lishizhenia sp.]|uniref:peptide chain release factor N(5)-glutamine methyltransferase n=1 Tax=Lishizhenia sp. TaxID=2497594 RepID=UPI00299E252D|nr:peptide chain release factor N(5)-glutamine methyltransferase [Lishizhenia sp.]MDX1447134.1 peptide chain release factor N(5)-glutamine methyltransferase [Lishizhenia sp.]